MAVLYGVLRDHAWFKLDKEQALESIIIVGVKPHVAEQSLIAASAARLQTMRGVLSSLYCS